jgi:2-polyprenyl-3-methyl-5-hydroxy-6-metoxy-1,4-benzoquinol methylase
MEKIELDLLDKMFSIYDKHYERMGNHPPDYSDIKSNPEKYILHEQWLPKNLNANILDIGCGWGILLYSLYCTGYKKLTGVDISEQMCKTARYYLPEGVKIVCNNALDFLKNEELNKYTLITIFDLAEHMSIDNFYNMLKLCYGALVKGGSVVIRTPNMANMFASYSRYIDITHINGFTEWSLFQLLDAAGFCDHQVIKPKYFSYENWKKNRSLIHPWRGLGLRELINMSLHKFLFWLRGQKPLPSHFSFNLVVQSWKR